MIKILNCIIFVAMVGANIWASVYGINGYTTGDVSSLYPTIFTPAGFTFSIWFLIYLALAGFCIFQFKASEEYNKAVNIFFILSSLLNVAWLFAWHYLIMGLSVLIILALLIVLIIIYRRINTVPLSKYKTWVLKVPFSIYLAWVSVAVISNVATYLASIGFIHYPELLTILMICCTFALALVMISTEHDLFFGLTICWALIGLISKYWQEPAYENIVITSVVGLIIIVVSTMVKNPKYFKKH